MRASPLAAAVDAARTRTPAHLMRYHRRMRAPNRRILLALGLLALATRLLWVLWVHPPADYVFRDMYAYLFNAQHVVDNGFAPHRHMAFQAWGTHQLLALPLRLFGRDALVPAGILWACLGAAAVPLIYVLACRVCSRPWVAPAVGFAALLWYPNVVNTGVFLAEAPLLGLLTAALWRMVVLVQEGRGALGCGLLCALCFALRPEVAIFFALAFGLWLWLRRARPAPGWRHVGLVVAPVALMLMFSLWHFHHHTGRWGGIAESARINLTIARCNHPRVQAYQSAEEFERDSSLKAGSSVGVASFMQRLRHRKADGLFALRPAFGTTPTSFEVPGEAGPLPLRISNNGASIQFIGHPADTAIHAAILRACIAQAGLLGQLHISLNNMSALWFFNDQWPDNSDRGERFLPWSHAFVRVFQWAVWLPSLLGIYWALRGARTNPGLALCALPVVGIMIVAAIWFGEIRFRTPYDPLALLLAADAYGRLGSLVWRRSSSPPLAAPESGSSASRSPGLAS